MCKGFPWGGGPCVEACHGVVGGGGGGRGRHPADRWGVFSGLGAPWGPDLGKYGKPHFGLKRFAFFGEKYFCTNPVIRPRGLR